MLHGHDQHERRGKALSVECSWKFVSEEVGNWEGGQPVVLGSNLVCM